MNLTSKQRDIVLPARQGIRVTFITASGTPASVFVPTERVAQNISWAKRAQQLGVIVTLRGAGKNGSDIITLIAASQIMEIMWQSNNEAWAYDTDWSYSPDTTLVELAS